MNRTLAFFLAGVLILAAGCTTVVHKVRDEPIRPDPGRTTLGTSLDDFQTETAIGVNIKKAHEKLEGANVNVHSYNGVVLLTGQVPSSELRSLAGDTARDYRGVRQVHNELEIGNSLALVNRANDGWLTTKVKSKLIASNEVEAGKIKVTTENGVVYLMGIVSKPRGDKAAEIASTTRGVRKVIKAFEYLDP